MGRDGFSSRTKRMVEPKELEKNNKTIALNVLYIPHNAKTISVLYRSEYNNKRKKQVILLMIHNGKNFHYLVVTNLSALFKRTLWNHDGEFYCLNWFSPYTTKNKLEETWKNMKKYATITIAVV